MFNSFLDVFIELYPDRSAANPVLVKTDGGPGRTNPENLAKVRENHIILFPGFPNGSGFNHEQVGVAPCVHCAHVAPRLTWDPKLSGICTERTTFLGRTDFLGSTCSTKILRIVVRGTQSILTDDSLVQSATFRSMRQIVTALRTKLRNIF
jgi:hypothetical protein